MAALRRVVAGDGRFGAREGRRVGPSRIRLARLAAAQRLVVTILGCSNSGVPPELVFDRGFGDLFESSARFASGFWTRDTAGSGPGPYSEPLERPRLIR
jgi:hypothetical protein